MRDKWGVFLDGKGGGDKQGGANGGKTVIGLGYVKRIMQVFMGVCNIWELLVAHFLPK